MASAELRAELDCSICLSPYTDPVSLRCGHNFCRSCIVRALDAQEARAYSCPDCRAEYPERPALEKNIKLQNIVARFLSTQPDMEETKVFCTYCIKSPVPAVRSCLQCENSFCDDHMTAHNKKVDHILTDPTSSFGNKKCSLHMKVLEYYCPRDAACLCVSCCLVGKHQGHQVELLNEASEKKKKKLREYLDKLNIQKVEIKSRVQNLLDHKKEVQEKAADKREDISQIVMDIKEKLETAEKKVLSEISRQEEKIMSQISDQIEKLEIQEDELSRKMRDVEEMCLVTDPIRLLQESDITVCGDDNANEETEEDGEICSEGDQDEELESDQGINQSDVNLVGEEEAPVSDDPKTNDDLDEVLISLPLHRSIRDIVTSVTSELGFQVPDMLLDVDTANECVEVSEDLKRASDSEVQDRSESPGRFMYYPQVLSKCGLSSGRHYWEVEWNQKGRCDIGVSYPSIEKDGEESGAGDNDKSWCLFLEDKEYSVSHNSVSESLQPTSPTFGVFLDYEAGRLSFYELSDPIRHLHTYTTTFTEPLHLILYVDGGAFATITS